MLALAAIFGVAVGLALGLTGGGGSIIAVPLLVYGQCMPPRQAVGVSLAAVGSLGLGTVFARRLSPVALQKVFAVAIVMVAAFVLAKNVA